MNNARRLDAQELNLLADKVYDIVYAAFPNAMVIAEQERGLHINIRATIYHRNRGLQASSVIGPLEFDWLGETAFVHSVGKQMRGALMNRMEEIGNDLRNARR